MQGIPLTNEVFLERVKKIHGDKYEYPDEFTRTKDKMRIICPEHGEFSQLVFTHLDGQGCKKCADESFVLSKQEFVDKAKIIHGDKYEYPGEYINTRTEMEIICLIHGSFWQKPAYHLSGSGCSECMIDALRMSQEDFIKKAIEIHGDKYDYSKVIYIDSQSQVTIICPEHGEFNQLANNHLRGKGCSNCAIGGFNSNKPGTLYYIKDKLTDLYKIGITNLEIKNRFIGKIKDIEILKTWYFELGADAYELEQFLFDELSEYRCINESYERNGKTEFFNKDVLNLDKI